MQLFSTARPDPVNKNAISIGPPFTLKLKVTSLPQYESPLRLLTYTAQAVTIAGCVDASIDGVLVRAKRLYNTC